MNFSVFVNLHDTSRHRTEHHAGIHFLVEEIVCQHFRFTELSDEQFAVEPSLSRGFDGCLSPARNVVDDTVQLLLGLGFFIGRRKGAFVFDGEGYGFTCQIVFLHHPQLLREAAYHLVLYLFRRFHVESICLFRTFRKWK